MPRVARGAVVDVGVDLVKQGFNEKVKQEFARFARILPGAAVAAAGSAI